MPEKLLLQQHMGRLLPAEGLVFGAPVPGGLAILLGALIPVGLAVLISAVISSTHKFCVCQWVQTEPTP